MKKVVLTVGVLGVCAISSAFGYFLNVDRTIGIFHLTQSPEEARDSRLSPLIAVADHDLEIDDVKIEYSVNGGATVVAVSGSVANTSIRRLPIPKLRGSFLDESNHELFCWTFTADSSEVDAGQKATFRTEVENPPEQARNWELRFLKPENPCHDQIAML